MSGAREAAPLLETARRALRESRFDDARAAFSRALEAAPESPAALHGLAVAELGRGEPESAASLIRRAIALDSRQALYHNNLGNALRALGRVEEAADAFAQAARIDPAMADAHYNEAVCRQSLGAAALARKGYLHTLELEPAHREAMSNLGAMALAEGDLDAAIDHLSRATAPGGGLAPAMLNLAIALERAGDLAAARDRYRAVVEAHPGWAEARYRWSGLLSKLGEAARSLDELIAATELDPDLVEAQRTLVERLEAVHDPRAALARSNLGTALLVRGESAEANRLFARNLALPRPNMRDLAHGAIAAFECAEEPVAGPLLDYPRLIEVIEPERVAPDGDAAGFASALAAATEAHPTLRADPQGNATREGLHSRELFGASDGPLADLEAVVRREAAAYIESVGADPAHPFLRDPPRRFRLTAWCVVLGEGGHQVAHIHPEAWLSGICYARVPDAVGGEAERAGWVEFGMPDPRFPVQREPPLFSVRPRPALLVLFPSYLYHRTLPFRGPETRISIAFDVVRED